MNDFGYFIQSIEASLIGMILGYILWIATEQVERGRGK